MVGQSSKSISSYKCAQFHSSVAPAVASHKDRQDVDVVSLLHVLYQSLADLPRETLPQLILVRAETRASLVISVTHTTA